MVVLYVNQTYPVPPLQEEPLGINSTDFCRLMSLQWPNQQCQSSDPNEWPGILFTARHYASEVYAVVVCLSVCLFVTRQYCTKTAKHRITPKCMITQTTRYNISWILVFWYQRSRQNSKGVTPMGVKNRSGVGYNWIFSINISLYLRNGARYGYSYYGMLTGTCMHSTECCYLQWPWRTHNYPKPPHLRYFVSPFVSL